MLIFIFFCERHCSCKFLYINRLWWNADIYDDYDWRRFEFD